MADAQPPAPGPGQAVEEPRSIIAVPHLTLSAGGGPSGPQELVNSGALPPVGEVRSVASLELLLSSKATCRTFLHLYSNSV